MATGTGRTLSSSISESPNLTYLARAIANRHIFGRPPACIVVSKRLTEAVEAAPDESVLHRLTPRRHDPRHPVPSITHTAYAFSSLMITLSVLTSANESLS